MCIFPWNIFVVPLLIIMFIRIFYSERCSESMNLWQVIFNEGINRMFIPVNVDKFSLEQTARLRIKYVPSIVINSENQQVRIYEGAQQCSDWLTGFTLNRRKQLAQQVDKQRRIIQRAQNDERKQSDGVLEYLDAEMDGISDNYAYNNTDLCQPKNFIMVGDEDKYAVITPQCEEGKLDIDTMKKQLAEQEKVRTDDNHQFMRMMEQNQIKAVINNNHSV
jgi:hypothetical protein